MFPVSLLLLLPTSKAALHHPFPPCFYTPSFLEFFFQGIKIKNIIINLPGMLDFYGSKIEIKEIQFNFFLKPAKTGKKFIESFWTLMGMRCIRLVQI